MGLRGGPAALTRTVIAGLAVLGIAAFADAAADGKSAAHTPPNDSFHGHIVSGTRRYAGKRDAVTVDISRSSSAGPRNTRFKITSRACRPARRCLDLAGTLHGSLVPGPFRPDVGETFTIRARGPIAPIGQAKASGTATGLGNIRYGHEEMRLVLKTSHGTITIHAATRLVPSFSSP